jgi:DNA-binding protein H-NS
MQLSRSRDVETSLAATEEMRILSERLAKLRKQESQEAERPKTQRELQLGGAR